jgi:uncharacterized protein
LRCRYCFYADVAASREVATHAIMSAATAELLASRLAEAVNGTGDVHISFQGGEPTVAGLGWFRAFAAAMDTYPEVVPHWSLQTNGTLLNEEWCSFFAEQGFLVGVSLDGPRSLTDFMRPLANWSGSFDRAMNGILHLQAEHIEFNILTVVTRQLAQKPKQLFQFYLQHDFADVQLIPCLPPLDGTDDGMSLRPRDYRNFYLGFFRAWQKGLQQEKLIRVNLFENVLGMLMGQPPYQCGMLGRCTVQYVIEANGDVYPCDFYCLDEYRLGNLADASLHELSTSAGAEAFLAGQAWRREPCATCPYARICNGGCRRQNTCCLTDEGCAYQDVLAQLVPGLARMYGLR